MMNSNRRIRTVVSFPLLALLALLIGLSGHMVAAAEQDLEAIAEEIVPVEVELHVNFQLHHRYLTGDPPAAGRDATTISFTSRGIYRFIRLREGLPTRYMVVPGPAEDPQFPTISNLRVYQHHTCHDNEESIIGRRGQDLSGSARIEAGSGGLLLSAADGDRVRISTGFWHVETDHVPCPTQPYCYDERTFHWSDTVAEDPDAWVETDLGEEYQGLELCVVDWSLISSIAAGGELPLVLPVSATVTTQEEGPGPAPEYTTTTCTVSGVIAPFDELSLMPLAPPPDDG